jgi:hypothetical protein
VVAAAVVIMVAVVTVVNMVVRLVVVVVVGVVMIAELIRSDNKMRKMILVVTVMTTTTTPTPRKLREHEHDNHSCRPAARPSNARDAYVHQPLDLQKLRRYEDRNDIRSVQLGRRKRVLQVVNKPLEDVDVAVHAGRKCYRMTVICMRQTMCMFGASPDVNVVAAVAVGDVGAKIRHLGNEYVLAAHKVLFDVAHMLKLSQKHTEGSWRARTSSDT